MENKHEKKEEEIGEVMDFSRPDFQFIPKGNHSWRQQGPYLVCKACDLEHATWIGMSKIMIGTKEDGQPILKNRIEERR
jgi:hypothetical protein